MPAVSGLAFTATVGSCGFMRPKAIRKTPYAVSTPNAIDPAEAPTNITRFKISVINFNSVYCTIFEARLTLSPRDSTSFERIIHAILAEKSKR
jgi:hypothetical protein